MHEVSVTHEQLPTRRARGGGLGQGGVEFRQPEFLTESGSPFPPVLAILNSISIARVSSSRMGNAGAHQDSDTISVQKPLRNV